MKLIKLILKNYTRLSVTGITHLEYRPEQPMQIILASNGAGKSSLLKEIIPNIEDLNNDYSKDGYRETVYLHNNNMYELTYTRNTRFHSFKKNGIELNLAGISKIQKTLIEEHFNINRNIHELLTSTTSLTTMNINERKRWFTEILSNTDYKYALDTYKQIKTKVRDLKAYINLTQSKILKDEEIFKNTTSKDIKALESDKKMFTIIIDELLDSKEKTINIDNIDKNIFNHYNLILEKLMKDLASINKDEKTLNNDILILNENIVKNNNEIKKINYDLNNIETVDINEDIDSLEKRLVELNNYVKDIDLFNFSLTLEDLKEIVIFIRKHYDNLTEFSMKLYELREIDLLKYDSNIYLLKVNELESTLKAFNDDKYKLEKELHLQYHNRKKDDVNCPKCSFIFKPNYNEDRVNDLEKEVNNIITKIDNHKTLLSKNKNIYNRIIDKQTILKQTKALLSNNNIMEKYIINQTDNFKNDISLNMILDKVRITLPDYSEIVNLIDNRLDILNKIEISKNTNINKNKLLLDKRNDLINKKNSLIKKNNLDNEFLLKCKRHSKMFLRLSETRLKLKDLVKNYNSYKKNNLSVKQNDYINNLVKITKEEIYNIDETVNKYKAVKDHYNQLTIDLKEYKRSLRINLKLEEYLSPNKGIIGLITSKTINIIIEKMNHIINQVWNYDISILSCDVDERGLTFKFPVKVNNAKIIVDIIKGSSSIKEIIDLAFKITAMELLDMLDYPLILDEFSKTMDPVHRISSYNYIDKLSKEHFTQIFMVSHYESMYNRFNNTDVNVLNNDNIGFKGVCNTRLKIKKK